MEKEKEVSLSEMVFIISLRSDIKNICQEFEQLYKEGKSNGKNMRHLREVLDILNNALQKMNNHIDGK